MVFYYILLQVLQAGVALIFFNAAKLLPALLYPLSVILFIGFFVVSVKIAKTILNTRTVFAVLLEVMVSIEIIYVFTLSFSLLIFAIMGPILIATLILFKVYREFSLKNVVWSVILTLLYKASLFVTYVVLHLDETFLGGIGILIFLTAFFFLKTYGKNPVDVKYTAVDAIVLFIGTIPFFVDLYLFFIALFLMGFSLTI